MTVILLNTFFTRRKKSLALRIWRPCRQLEAAHLMVRCPSLPFNRLLTGPIVELSQKLNGMH